MTEHQYHTRVYYEDTDAGGVVFHAAYLHFMERARTELLRDAGFAPASFLEGELRGFVVADLAAKYKAPARLDDPLVVKTTITEMSRVAIFMRQNIYKRVAEGESLLLEGLVTLVLINASTRATRLPDGLRATLQPYLSDRKAN